MPDPPKECPHCKAAGLWSYTETDYYGTYRACYYCGYLKDVHIRNRELIRPGMPAVLRRATLREGHGPRPT